MYYTDSRGNTVVNRLKEWFNNLAEDLACIFIVLVFGTLFIIFYAILGVFALILAAIFWLTYALVGYL